MGTRIKDLQVTEVIDGDTIKVELDDEEESLRLTCVDTEESRPGSDKPVTRAGKEASEMAKEYFASDNGELERIDLESDTNDSIDVCKDKHRDNYGRLLCYVHKDEENYNLKLVREGWSPYFSSNTVAVDSTTRCSWKPKPRRRLTVRSSGTPTTMALGSGVTTTDSCPGGG